MKKLFGLFCAIFLVSSFSFGQGQAETYITEAQNFLKQKNYKQAQMSLQDAINEINNYLAKEILTNLPTEINGLKADINQDNSSSGGMNFVGGGMAISRKYVGKVTSNYAEINIVANSPLIGSLSMFMNNPMLLGASGNQKSIRFGTRRAILKTESEDVYDDNGNSKSMPVFEVQMPVNQTLITLKGNGFENETAFMAFANKFEFEKIIKAIGE